MQLFAIDKQGQLVAAGQAESQADYRCIECDGIIRRRSGPHRQPHFFHLRESHSCFLSGKGMAHLQIQCRLWQLLPKGECQLEHRFSAIGRIADVAWLPQRLIFEVQCSPISPEEIAARNRDYASVGFQVVWILHDSQYNKRRVSAAEQLLSDRIHYFSNMNAEGQGEIYDQFDLKKEGRRIIKMGKLNVNLSEPKERSDSYLRPAWPLHFAGDLLDQANETYLQEALAIQRSLHPPFYRRLMRPFKLILQILLERACR